MVYINEQGELITHKLCGIQTVKLCSVRDCKTIAHKKGLCGQHFRNFTGVSVDDKNWEKFYNAALHRPDPEPLEWLSS